MQKLFILIMAINIDPSVNQPILSTRKRADTSALVDPMQAEGYINIRIKPPMNTKGLKRMSFPADCTVTISGPIATPKQVHALEHYAEVFNSIDSQYFVSEKEISSSSRFARRITMKSTREEFIKVCIYVYMSVEFL